MWGPPALGTAGWEWDIQGGHKGYWDKPGAPKWALGTLGWSCLSWWALRTLGVGSGNPLGIMGWGWDTWGGPWGHWEETGWPKARVWGAWRGPYSRLADATDPDLAGVGVPARQVQQQGIGAIIMDGGQAPAEAPGTDALQGNCCHGGHWCPHSDPCPTLPIPPAHGERFGSGG